MLIYHCPRVEFPVPRSVLALAALDAEAMVIQATDRRPTRQLIYAEWKSVVTGFWGIVILVASLMMVGMPPIIGWASHDTLKLDPAVSIWFMVLGLVYGLTFGRPGCSQRGASRA